MQENSKQQYPTNPMDSPSELSQSSYSYMGFEGDADVRFKTPHYVALQASSTNEHNSQPSFMSAKWKPAGDLAPFGFNPANSGEWVYYESQVNHPDGNNSTFRHTPGFVGDGQDTFTQPLAFHGSPLVFNGLDSAPWDFPSRDLNGVVASAAIDFSSSLGLDNGGPPGFQNHPGQNVCDQLLAQSDDATGSLPSWNFHTTGTSTAVNLPALGLESAIASGLQSYGSQNAWNQTPSQNNAAASSSWGQSMIDPPFNRVFRPPNVDEGFVDAGVELPMIWPINTNMEGDFQRGIGSNTPAPSTQWNDRNMIWPPALVTASPPQQNPGLNQTLPANLPGPQPPALVPALAATNTTGPTRRFQCTMCTKAFKRDFERTRHEASVHSINRRLHLCLVPGCPRSHGNGFSRPDKVTEHLWRKHANLGYTKAA